MEAVIDILDNLESRLHEKISTVMSNMIQHINVSLNQIIQSSISNAEYLDEFIREHIGGIKISLHNTLVNQKLIPSNDRKELIHSTKIHNVEMIKPESTQFQECLIDTGYSKQMSYGDDNTNLTLNIEQKQMSTHNIANQGGTLALVKDKNYKE